MKHRPIILSLTSMHEAGLRILREAAELRMASALDPATLQREVVGADGSSSAPAASSTPRCSIAGDQAQGRRPAWRRLRSDRRRRGDGPRHPGRLHAGANTQSVAEHVFALMIGLSRHFPRMMAGLAAGNYHVRTSMTGREIAGKSLGIIGFGRIGRRVGEIAHVGSA